MAREDRQGAPMVDLGTYVFESQRLRSLVDSSQANSITQNMTALT